MSVWVIIVAIGLLTFASRLAPILSLERVTIPDGIQRALRFVPIAVLSAIIVPALVLRDGTLALTPHNARLMAGALAVLVAWATRNALATIAVGMGALWLLQWVLR